MDFSAWGPQYARIQAEFGFTWEAERASADRLEELLPESARDRPLERLEARLVGRPSVIVGLAPGAGAPPLWLLPPSGPRPTLVAADGATERCLAAGLVPDVVVTDLDGPVPSEVTANTRGSFVLVHAHGDNRPAIERWVPELHGELAGSWAGPPRPALIDVGGFTDGDRAAYLAAQCGATRVLLWGFDFERVPEGDARAAERKRAKLRWARDDLLLLASMPGPAIEWWGRDGSRKEFRQIAVESTQ